MKDFYPILAVVACVALLCGTMITCVTIETHADIERAKMIAEACHD